jgi:acyl dehydratase
MTQPATRALGPDFAAPIDDRYFEDYLAGSVYEYGYLTVTEDEILAYAREFDPQKIHIDREYADAGPFKGLIASGWHTGGVCMKFYVAHYLSHAASLASPGIDELRWPAPVRPGDTLRMRATITETRPSQSKPDRGLIVTTCELFNQDDVKVMSMRAMNLVGKRPMG